MREAEANMDGEAREAISAALGIRECQSCGGRAFVVDSRDSVAWIRRRYRCDKGHRFTTIELAVGDERCVDIFSRVHAPPKAPVAAPEQHIFMVPIIQNVPAKRAPPAPVAVAPPKPTLPAPRDRLEMGHMLGDCVSEIRETLAKLTLLSELQSQRPKNGGARG